MRDVAGAGVDHYYLHEELYSVAGMAASNGMLEEAVVYETYGQAAVYEWPSGDVDRDGTVENDDKTAVQGSEGNYEPLHDVNLDGSVTSADTSVVDGQLTDVAVLRTYSSLGNPYLFTGRTTDTLCATSGLVSEDGSFRRIQDNRNRMYDPHHGRWFQRDPLGVRPDAPRGTIEVLKQLADGPNLYNYVMSCPTQFSDAEGTRTWLPENWYIGLRCVAYCGCRGIAASAQSATTAGYNAANELIKRNDSAHRAIRHCVASGLLATKVGCSCAQCLGDKAEDFQDENGQAKRNSDRARFNNRQGRICAGCVQNGDRNPTSGTLCFSEGGNTVCIPKPVFPTASLTQIIKCCTDKLKNGELDSGSGPSPPDTPTPD
jgi:RHS repeat-associated protein